MQRAPVTLYSQNRTWLPNPEKELMVSAHGHSELTKLGETVCQANRALVWGQRSQQGRISDSETGFCLLAFTSEGQIVSPEAAGVIFTLQRRKLRPRKVEYQDVAQPASTHLTGTRPRVPPLSLCKYANSGDVAVQPALEVPRSGRGRGVVQHTAVSSIER